MRHFARSKINHLVSPRALFASVEKIYSIPRPFALPQIIIIVAVILDPYGDLTAARRDFRRSWVRHVTIRFGVVREKISATGKARSAVPVRLGRAGGCA